QSITVLPPNQAWQNFIGQRDHLSTGDIAGLRHVYCGGSWSQAPAPNIAPPRGYVAAAYDSVRNRTVLFGGYNDVGVPGGVLGDTWESSGAGWNLVSSSGPPARSSHSMAFD